MHRRYCASSRDLDIRLRNLADRLAITERSAFGIVIDLAEAGYIVKQKDGRRNRYQIQADLPLPEFGSRERTVGEVLALVAGGEPQRPVRRRETRARCGAARRAGE